jgi:AcrR family transcriptional regulator
MSDILDCFSAELQEKPYDKVTISDICRRAKVSRKTFYRYFHSKQACLLAVIDRHLSASYEEATQGGLQAYFIYWRRNSAFLQTLRANELYPLLVEQAVLFIKQSLALNWDACRIHFVVTGVLCVIVQWIELGCEETVDDLGKELHKVLSVPLLTLLSNEDPPVCFYRMTHHIGKKNPAC